MNTLTLKQWTFCIGYGLALWISALFLIRIMAPFGAFSGIGLLISFAALIPGTLPSVLLAQRVMGPSQAQLLIGVTLISTTALLLAAISFSFFPSIYGNNLTHLLAASGFMMWGAGIGFVLALIVSRNR